MGYLGAISTIHLLASLDEKEVSLMLDTETRRIQSKSCAFFEKFTFVHELLIIQPSLKEEGDDKSPNLEGPLNSGVSLEFIPPTSRSNGHLFGKKIRSCAR
jgi:hypothetical protein